MAGTSPLSLENASILIKVKECYLIWMGIVPHIPKTARFTLGARIEDKFLDLLELSYASYFSSATRKSSSAYSERSSAYFSEKDKKAEKLSECIFTLDILKFLVSTAWEGKFISNKHYESVAIKLDEMGKMFWGWKKSLDNPQKTPPIKQSLRLRLKAGKR